MRCVTTQILVVTPGLLLRKLQSDNFLEGITIIITIITIIITTIIRIQSCNY